MGSDQRVSNEQNLRKILVYIMGPLEARTLDKDDIKRTRVEHERVHHAAEVGERLSRLGFSVYVPHLNWYMGNWFLMDRSTILEIEMEVLRRSDVGFFLGSSPGADAERKEMIKLGKPVFEKVEDLLIEYGIE